MRIPDKDKTGGFNSPGGYMTKTNSTDRLTDDELMERLVNNPELVDSWVVFDVYEDGSAEFLATGGPSFPEETQYHIPKPVKLKISKSLPNIYFVGIGLYSVNRKVDLPFLFFLPTSRAFYTRS